MNCTRPPGRFTPAMRSPRRTSETRTAKRRGPAPLAHVANRRISRGLVTPVMEALLKSRRLFQFERERVIDVMVDPARSRPQARVVNRRNPERESTAAHQTCFGHGLAHLGRFAPAVRGAARNALLGGSRLSCGFAQRELHHIDAHVEARLAVSGGNSQMRVTVIEPKACTRASLGRERRCLSGLQRLGVIRAEGKSCPRRPDRPPRQRDRELHWGSAGSRREDNTAG